MVIFIANWMPICSSTMALKSKRIKHAKGLEIYSLGHKYKPNNWAIYINLCAHSNTISHMNYRKVPRWQRVGVWVQVRVRVTR